MTDTSTDAAHVANFAAQAIAMLAKCLRLNGALIEGQFEAELRATIEADGAERGRPDYAFLEVLLQVLEDKVPKPH